MIKISVLYPNTAGSWFDHDYHSDVHMPKLKTLLGETCPYYTDTVPVIQISSVVVEHS